MGFGEQGHDMRFDELVVGRSSSEDEVRCDASFEFTDAFERPFTLFRRRGSVRVGRIAEDDDGVEVGEVGVGGGNASIDENTVYNREDY